MLKIGETLGDFRVMGMIGRGAMGEVFLAQDAELNRRVAIKIIRHATEPIRQAALRELRAGVGLLHANIVRILGGGEAHGDPYVVMEYVEGATLQDLFRQQIPRNVPEKITLMTQLCAGLAYAHRAGVVHGDITPGNVMVTRNGVLKILDFGMASIGSAYEPKLAFGTIAYMAPEQANGATRDRRWDIFASGAIFYELLSGRRAFAGDPADILTRKARGIEPEPLDQIAPGINRTIAAVVSRCLAMHPAHRYSGMDDVARDLRDAVATSKQ